MDELNQSFRPPFEYGTKGTGCSREGVQAFSEKSTNRTENILIRYYSLSLRHFNYEDGCLDD